MKKRVIIIEDEKYASEQLIHQLSILKPDWEVGGVAESISQSITLLSKQTPDLLFVDIHLSDGISFDLFEKISIRTPIIFTTAYDQYAIQAFKVNSIDYLLKPIATEDLAQALEKFESLQPTESQLASELKNLILGYQSTNYRQRFLVKKGEQLVSIPVRRIAYFEGEDRYVTLHTKEGKKYFVDHTLGELEELLDPGSFFRLNRSFISCHESIKEMIILSKSRIKIILIPATNREVIVSTQNTRIFKSWLAH